MKRLLLAALLASASPAIAGNIANCEVMLMDAVETGAAASFMDAGPVVQSMLDPDAPILAAIEGRVVQAVMCTRRDPIPDAEDTPLIASGIPFILSTDFDSGDAPLVTLALDAEGAAVARMAVGLSERQQERLEAFLAAYEPPRRVETVSDLLEPFVEDEDLPDPPSDSSDDEAAPQNETAENPAPIEGLESEDGEAMADLETEEISDAELQSALDDLMEFLGEDLPDDTESDE